MILITVDEDKEKVKAQSHVPTPLILVTLRAQSHCSLACCSPDTLFTMSNNFSLSVPGDDGDAQSGREARRARRHSRGGSDVRDASPLPSEVNRIATTLSKTPTATTRTFTDITATAPHKLSLDTEAERRDTDADGDDAEYEEFVFHSPRAQAFLKRQNTEERISAAHAESARRWGAEHLHDKWSHTVAETKTKNGFGKNHVIWAFVLDDDEQRIDLYHSIVSGKKRLIVNGVEKDVSGSKFGTNLRRGRRAYQTEDQRDETADRSIQEGRRTRIRPLHRRRTVRHSSRLVDQNINRRDSTRTNRTVIDTIGISTTFYFLFSYLYYL